MNNSAHLDMAIAKALYVAIIVTGSAQLAERSVIELRDLSEAFDRMLWPFSIAASIGAQKISHTVNPSETESTLSTLPFELRGIFLLTPTARNCFVSRILVGLAKDACARILGFTEKQVDAYTCAALHELSR